MQRITELDAVLDHIWERLTTAADEPGDPLRALTFGTSHAEIPRLRTVILRRADAEERVLAFHSDRRAQKVDDIRGNRRVAWLGWDPDTNEQIRLSGTATVYDGDDAVADEMWADERPPSLGVYVRPSAPGTPLEQPADGLSEAVRRTPLTRQDVAEGREHFAVVRTTLDRIDWLHLHAEGHYRAQFELDSETEAFDGSWVVP